MRCRWYRNGRWLGTVLLESKRPFTFVLRRGALAVGKIWRKVVDVYEAGAG
jgi:hypothetical protein